MLEKNVIDKLALVSQNQSYSLDLSEELISKGDLPLILNAIRENRDIYTTTSNLHAINLPDCDIDDDALLQILQALPMSVIAIGLSDNKFGVSGLRNLGLFLQNRRIIRLDISSNACFASCDEETFKIFLFGLFNSKDTLADLSLVNTELPTGLTSLLSECIAHLNALRHLDLSELRVAPKELVKLLSQISRTNIQVLHLDNIELNDVVDYVCEAIILMPRLYELQANRCKLTSDSLAKLCFACANFIPRLQFLSFDDNGVTDEAMPGILSVLERCHELSDLSLTNNKLTDVAAAQLAKFLSTSFTRVDINLLYNLFTKTGRATLQDAAKVCLCTSLKLIEDEEEEEEQELTVDSAAKPVHSTWPLLVSSAAGGSKKQLHQQATTSSGGNGYGAQTHVLKRTLRME